MKKLSFAALCFVMLSFGESIEPCESFTLDKGSIKPTTINVSDVEQAFFANSPPIEIRMLTDISTQSPPGTIFMAETLSDCPTDRDQPVPAGSLILGEVEPSLKGEMTLNFETLFPRDNPKPLPIQAMFSTRHSGSHSSMTMSRSGVTMTVKTRNLGCSTTVNDNGKWKTLWNSKPPLSVLSSPSQSNYEPIGVTLLLNSTVVLCVKNDFSIHKKDVMSVVFQSRPRLALSEAEKAIAPSTLLGERFVQMSLLEVVSGARNSRQQSGFNDQILLLFRLFLSSNSEIFAAIEQMDSKSPMYSTLVGYLTAERGIQLIENLHPARLADLYNYGNTTEYFPLINRELLNRLNSMSDEDLTVLMHDLLPVSDMQFAVSEELKRRASLRR